MGPRSNPLAVVDPELKVHGLSGLRIIDASVMPMMPSANTYAATLMIAEKGADLVLGRRAA
jgi:choline dehydrogenase